MQTVALVGVLAVAALTVLQAPLPASGVCCRPPGSVLSTYFKSGDINIAGYGGGIELRHHLCNDCTRPTPYCSYGGCNLFGCCCDGGCREGRCQRRKRATEGEDYPTDADADADADADGALSMREAKRLLRANGVAVDRAALRALDVNRDGKLTPEEIDSTD